MLTGHGINLIPASARPGRHVKSTVDFVERRASAARVLAVRFQQATQDDHANHRCGAGRYAVYRYDQPAKTSPSGAKNCPQSESVGSKIATAWRLAGLADQSSDAVVLRAGNSINIALYGFPQATSGRRPAEWNPG
jgi:hypothetical protein